jgi:hypothetical protein
MPIRPPHSLKPFDLSRDELAQRLVQAARSGAQALMRQPIYSWLDRSIEPIMVQSSVSYDDETRAAILASNDPEAIARFARGQR